MEDQWTFYQNVAKFHSIRSHKQKSLKRILDKKVSLLLPVVVVVRTRFELVTVFHTNDFDDPSISMDCLLLDCYESFEKI